MGRISTVDPGLADSYSALTPVRKFFITTPGPHCWYAILMCAGPELCELPASGCLVVEPWLQADTASSTALTAATTLKRFLITIASTFGQSLSSRTRTQTPLGSLANLGGSGH